MTIKITTDRDGCVRHYKDGIPHRDDGPAIAWPDGYKAWYYNGKRHRDDGPAIIWPNGSLEWYLNGTKYSFDEWCKKVNITDQQRTLLMLQYRTELTRHGL